MRVLILGQYFHPEVGASQVRLLVMAKELKRAGHDVQVLTALPNYPTGRIFPEYSGRLWRNETIDGIPVRRMWLIAATGRGLFRMLNFFSFCTTALIGAIGLGEFDLVLVSSPPYFLGVVGWLLARFYNGKFVFYVGDLWPDTFAELGMIQRKSLTYRVLESLERWIYNGADVVSTATQGIRTRIIQEKGIPERKVIFTPNGVDVDLFQPSGESESTEGKIMFLYAGLHGYAQGLELLLHAAERLVDREDIVIWIVGEGPTKADILRKAEGMALPNVRFFDARPMGKMPPLLRAARASLVPLVNSPLFADARPSKMFPAWACGIPTVYCGFGEAAELVSSEGMGWVVPPEDPDALAQCLRELADHPQEAKLRGLKGRDYVEANLGWPRIVEQWWREVASIAGWS